MAVDRTLDGKVALVTGGAGGIGRATVIGLAARGADVVVIDIDVDRGRETVELAAQHDVRAQFCRSDVSDSAAVRSAVEQVTADLGGIDILANVAGVGGAGVGRIVDTSDEDWERLFAIDLRSVFLCMREVGRQMIKQGRGGRIVSVSSSSAFRGAQANAAYSAAKAGINGLTRVAAAEFGPFDINVNAVAPGLTATPMNARMSLDEMEAIVKDGSRANFLGRLSLAEDVAETIIFLVLPASRQITGQVIHTSAGIVL